MPTNSMSRQSGAEQTHAPAGANALTAARAQRNLTLTHVIVVARGEQIQTA